ncbi:MAG: hypothetical protein K2N48_06510 [Muribaculaceae bacterium]|nr:hypothetical protein [Muribaculaceae bacterium]
MKHAFLITLLCILCCSPGSARDLVRGYRGFVEWDNAIGKTDYWNDEILDYDKDTLWFLGLSTSHGFQFNPHLYIGIGCMLSCANPTGDITIPVFADIRYDAKFGKFTPFVDFRGGFYSDGTSYGGLYITPTIGYSFQHAKKINFNLGLGVTLRDVKVFYSPEYESERKMNTLFTIRFSIDFK